MKSTFLIQCIHKSKFIRMKRVEGSEINVCHITAKVRKSKDYHHFLVISSYVNESWFIFLALIISGVSF